MYIRVHYVKHSNINKSHENNQLSSVPADKPGFLSKIILIHSSMDVRFTFEGGWLISSMMLAYM